GSMTRRACGASAVRGLPLLLLLSATSGVAETYWMSPSGIDENPCAAIAGAADPGVYMKTWLSSAECLAPGDTVILKDGTYVDPMQIRTSGTASARITVRAQNSRKAIFAGTSWPAVMINFADYVTLQGIKIDALNVACDFPGSRSVLALGASTYSVV